MFYCAFANTCIDFIYIFFKGWKNEDVVVNCLNGRIIRIRPSDSKVWWKKVKEVLEVVSNDLGYCETPLETETSQVSILEFNCYSGTRINYMKAI